MKIIMQPILRDGNRFVVVFRLLWHNGKSSLPRARRLDEQGLCAFYGHIVSTELFH
jgi:hypothetical protein